MPFRPRLPAVLLAVLPVLLPFATLPAHAQTGGQNGNQNQNARPTLSVVNKSGQEIEELYVSTTRNSDWGDDRLGNNTIEKNGTFRVRLTEGCLYDIQVVYDDKRTEERMRVNVCRTPAQTFTAAEAHAPPAVPTHQFTLENRTGRPIASLVVAEDTDGAGEEDWGDNLLTEPLAPGAHVSVNTPGECSVAARVLFDNGSGQQRHGVSVCGDGPVLAVGPNWASEDAPGARAPEPPIPVTVTNKGRNRVVELYLFPDSDTQAPGAQGSDRLGTRILEPGADIRVDLQRNDACRFTVRSVFEGKVPDEVTRGVDFCPRQAVTVGTATP